MQQITESYTNPTTLPPASVEARELGSLEASFVTNWAALARAFGMDPMLGRVHALAYLSERPIPVMTVSTTLGLGVQQSEAYLAQLEAWGVIREVGGEDLERSYQAELDPWSFFLSTLKERGRREFAPLLQSIRTANAQAMRIQARRGHSDGAAERLQRIARFSQFVEQMANLLETFASLGAGPMLTTMRMVAKMRGPRLLRM
ncbi:MAG: hypothetical protein OEZ06_03250 [Myxococcales bacterium]|nr:hypothetical protein [Myxococcales bacterium]